MSSTGALPSQTDQTSVSLPQELLICVFIHGFKGDDGTFGDFPNRLEHVLKETLHDVRVECVVFPVYETKGDLNAAVERFADWLTTLTVEKEVAHGIGGGAGKARIVLCGHSMGGLLAADTFLAMANSRPDPAAPLWPSIIACLAFDTPYLGVHPYVFRNSATKAITFAQTARDVATGVGVLGALGSFAFGKKPNSNPSDGVQPKSQKEKDQEAQGLGTVPPPMPPPGAQDPTATPPRPSSAGESSGANTPTATKSAWQKLAYGAGATLLAGAAAGAAYYNKDSLTTGWTWAADHMRFVGTLWDETALKDRVENVVKCGEELGVLFRTFYTYIPGKPPVNPNPRTFVILPQAKSPYGKYFVAAHNRLAVDEVGAHTSMFHGTSNDGYYELGLQTTRAIREAVMLSRGEKPTDLPDSVRESFAQQP